jgi:hypothetical protein
MNDRNQEYVVRAAGLGAQFLRRTRARGAIAM